MNKKIGSFKLCGIDYIILDNTQKCHDNERKWCFSNPEGIVEVQSKSVTGQNLSVEVIEDFIWDAILYIIIGLTMEKRNITYKNSYIGYANAIIQGIKTLKWDNEKGVGSVEILNTTYNIKENNNYANDNNFLGRFDDRNLEILITNKLPNNNPHKKEFVTSTIFHEIIHGVNFKLGYGGAKRNEEDFVNILGSFITEVYYSLKVYNTNYCSNLLKIETNTNNTKI